MMTEEQLESLGYTFPQRINIYLTRDESGKYSLIFRKFSNKKIKIGNIKFSDTGAWLFDGTSCISLGVYDFATFEDFYKEVDLLNARWTRTKAVQNDEV